MRSETDPDESPKRPAPGFLFSQSIGVRGKEYGRLQLDLRQPTHSPHLLLEPLETVAWLLALYAERASLNEENERLRVNLKALQNAVVASKVGSRAAGVVAGMRQLPFDQALVWIQSEATRTRRPVAEVAERVLLYQDSRERLVLPGVPAA